MGSKISAKGQDAVEAEDKGSEPKITTAVVDESFYADLYNFREFEDANNGLEYNNKKQHHRRKEWVQLVSALASNPQFQFPAGYSKPEKEDEGWEFGGHIVRRHAAFETTNRIAEIADLFLYCADRRFDWDSEMPQEEQNENT